MSHDIFIPSVRRGLSALASGRATAERARLDVILHVRGHMASGVDDGDVPQAVELYGPGDVVGFEPRAVTRTDPSPGIGDFESNYFPTIEFADEDFVWRMAGKPTLANGSRQPWITLVVLRLESNGETAEFRPRERRDGDRAPSIVVSTEFLPNLEHAWRWAHAQVFAETTDEVAPDKLAKLLQDQPARGVCRLLCARRLKPRSRYQAFVVPTFRSGVKAALPDTQAPSVPHELAWIKKSAEVAKEIELPYYYTWEFGTSQRGDFEYLARLLEGRDLNAIGIGVRPLDCSRPGFNICAEQLHLGMEGALVPVSKDGKKPWTPWGADSLSEEHFKKEAKPYQQKIAHLINPSGSTFVFKTNTSSAGIDVKGELIPKRLRIRVLWSAAGAAVGNFVYTPTLDNATPTEQKPVDKGDGSYEVILTKLRPGIKYDFAINFTHGTKPLATGTFTVPALPCVVPPIYGRWHAAQSSVSTESLDTWLDHVNLDPRHRAAAGLGAEVVRKNQEALMASAWEQLGAVEVANNLLRRAQLGREVTRSMRNRLERLTSESLLGITWGMQKRVLFKEDQDKPQTFAKRIARAGAIQPAVLGRAFRRIQRPTSPIRKRLRNENGIRSDTVIAKLSSASVTPTVPAHEVVPSGTTGIGAITRRLATAISSDRAVLNFSEESIAKLLLEESVPELPQLDDELPWMDDAAVTKPPVSHDTVVALLKALGSRDAETVPEAAPADFLPGLRTKLLGKLRADRSILARLRIRFPPHLQQILDKRLPELDNGDDLDEHDALEPILWAPDFPQPMYEPLRDLGHEFLLPGVEKFPQNTIAILETNRRFLEAYLLGCNHEFAAELLWRRYPTDQRGSYFRQFWDVSGYVPTDDQVEGKDELLLLQREALRDIRKLHLWKAKSGGRLSRLGENAPKAAGGLDPNKGGLVLAIRGDVIRRYPGALIYAVNAIEEEGMFVPALEEYAGSRQPEFPLFQATLPPDLVFFGFNFTEADARSEPSKRRGGKFFVIEQRPGEPRFGLDEPPVGNPAATDSSDLDWSSFGLGSAFGKYLDDAEVVLELAGGNDWTNASSAVRALLTLQQPVRIVIHADDLLPKLLS